MTVDRCQVLVVRCWLLVVGCSLLVPLQRTGVGEFKMGGMIINRGKKISMLMWSSLIEDAF